MENEIKRNYGPLIIMSCLTLLFGWIVTKDVQLHPGILMGGFAIGGIILFFKGINNPAVVTYVLVAYLPFSRILVGDFGGAAMALNFTNLLMAFIIFVWMTGRFSVGEPLWLKTPLNVPIILFMIMGFISILRTQMMYGDAVIPTLIEYKRWITPFFMYFLVLNTVKDREMMRNVIIIMMIATTVVGLMAIYDYIDLGHVSRLEKARIGGITEQPNMLAAFFNYYMFLPIGFFLINSHKGIQYWLLLIPFLIQFRGIMVTFSRGGYLGFAVGVYAIAFIRNKLLFFLLLFVTVIVYMNPQLLPAGIRYRMGQTVVQHNSELMVKDIDTKSLESSSQNRIEVWKGAIKMIQDHPVWGVGYGLFQPMIAYYWSGRVPIDAHNTYLSIAGEMGIPSLLIFLWIIFVIITNAWKLYSITVDPFVKAFSLGFLGGLFALLMSNMFGSRLIAQEISSYLWILSALMMRYLLFDQARVRDERKEEIKKRQLEQEAMWSS